jgi:hypothetical protein
MTLVFWTATEIGKEIEKNKKANTSWKRIVTVVALGVANAT